MPFDPAIILTAAGAVATAAAITAVLELFKKLIPPLDGASATRKQQLVAVLALGAVVYAAIATNVAIDPISIGGLAIAWFGIARLATATYDTAKALTGSSTG